MAQRLGERRPGQYLHVVMGVDIEHSGDHPFARGIDQLRAAGVIEVVRADGDDVSAADTDVANGGRGARAVEPASATDDCVVGHPVIRTVALTGVNENREQIRTGVYFGRAYSTP